MLVARKPIPYSKNGNKPRFVYALVDPRDSRIRYVGCSWNPQKRLFSHIADANRHRSPADGSPKVEWLHDLIQNDLRPIVVKLQECSPVANWLEVENEWIQRLVKAGAELTNVRTIAGYDNLNMERYLSIERSYKVYEYRKAARS